jgi:hypothetical protein
MAGKLPVIAVPSNAFWGSVIIVINRHELFLIVGLAPTYIAATSLNNLVSTTFGLLPGSSIAFHSLVGN